MASRSPKVAMREAAASCVDANTTFVQADPATFRALVQKLTGAPEMAAEKPQEPHPEQDAAVTVTQAPPPAPLPRRPKLQERRRAAPPRLELVRPHRQAFHYYHHHHHSQFMHSPVSPMDAYVLASSSSPSLSSSSSMSPSPRGVMISKEEEEREEKAIASKAFYLHSPSPRSAAADGDRPKLLPLFPVHSPRSSFFAS